MPAPVADMLARYHDLRGERGDDWGKEYDEVGRALMRIWPFCDPSRLLATLQSGVVVTDDLDFLQVVVDALPDPLPSGVAVLRADGVDVGQPLPLVAIGGETRYVVIAPQPGGAVPDVLDVSVPAHDPFLEVGGHRVHAAEQVATGRMRLVGDAPSRWSVVDGRGGGWFPPGVLRKYDFHGRPFFHGNHVAVDVPAGRVVVSVARGCEYRPATVELELTAGDEVVVGLSPTRLYDAAARGWYGGDLHVHLNYSGDLVATPDDAAQMQQGEALHLMNLVAANASTGLIYDREALEVFAGSDLPWSADDVVARWGVEYRNDLFGHFHALNPSAPPTRYNTGHDRSDEPQDWPPNSVAAAELRGLGATVGYTHPVMTPMGEGGSPAPVFEQPAPIMGLRTMHARELVADAALGLVDSVDVVGGEAQSLEATEYLYHRLLGCGLRLAATAGTDVMLSRSRGLSNPPGWGRAYAHLDGRPLSVPAWQDAVRAGRTFATNGPWLELDVAGHGPGATLAGGAPARVPVVARVVGLGVQTLEIVGPDGTIAVVDVPPDAEQAELTAEVDAGQPGWVAAVARGAMHPSVLGPQVYAHTSPVWVDVDGESIARADDARWCLDWLDRFERLGREHGRFTADGQLEDLVAVIDEARRFYRAIVDAAAR